MGSGSIPGGGEDDLLVLIQNHIDNVVNAADAPGFFDVHPQGIAFQPSGAGFVLHHHPVIGLNGVPAGYAGHNGLGSAGIARKIVVFHISKTDAEVCFRNHPGDIHGGAPAGDTHADAVAAI